jgi:hypothetical protein
LKLVATLPVRNEDWCLALSARVALQWCDSLIVLVHACSDLSEFILRRIQEEFPGKVTLLFEDGLEWQEMNHRQKLLEAARKDGATHIAIVDADEILTGNLIGSIRDTIERLPRGRVLQLPGYNLRGSINRYHANGIWGKRVFSVAFADDSRLHWGGDTFHHREPFGPMLQPWCPVAQGQGGVMHLWGLDERRLRAKHAAYKMIETLRWPNKARTEINRIYNQAFDPAANRQFDQAWQFAETPVGWWEPYAPLMQYLRAEAVPWQEQECRKLYAQHGAERFTGLDLFGVCEMAAA